MKKLIFLFALSCITLPSLAQDPELFDNPWYLEKVVIDGEDIIPPYLVIEPRIGRISFDVDAVSLEFCDILVCDVTYDSIEDIFTLGSWVALPGSCDQPENFNFAPIYNSIFYDGVIPKNPFSYDIVSEGGGVLMLTITNGEDNQAIYGNVLLSTPEVNFNEIILYPNPTNSIIFIESSQYAIDKVEILNLLGQNVGAISGNVQSIDISNLASGLYLLKIYSDNLTAIKRIIKR